MAGRGHVIGWVALVIGVAAAVRGWRHEHERVRRLCRESLVVLTIAVSLQVLAGIVLASREEGLVAAVPRVLGLVPPFAATCGSLGGLLASRLSSKLHIGIIEPRLLPGKVAGLDVSLTFLLALLAFTGIGAIGWVAPAGRHRRTERAGPGGRRARRRTDGHHRAVERGLWGGDRRLRFGLDPDNHGIPIVTAAMDFLGILCLVSAVAITGVG